MTDIVEKLKQLGANDAAAEVEKMRADLAACRKEQYLTSKYRNRKYRIYLRLKREFENE